jgi:hypothetical protein
MVTVLLYLACTTLVIGTAVAVVVDVVSVVVSESFLLHPTIVKAIAIALTQFLLFIIVFIFVIN